MVYAAGSLALAALEVLVHLPPQMRRAGGFPAFVAVCLDMPDSLAVQAMDPDLSALTATRSIGDAWAKGRTSLALWVPSLVIPQEVNLLINPAHPEIEQVQVTRIVPFRFDDRLGT